nr:zinc finger, CCHC-type [Tanacetum cinerariifolium]
MVTPSLGSETLNIEESWSWFVILSVSSPNEPKVLHGFKFEVELLGDHTFKVEPQENIDQRAGNFQVEGWMKDDMDARSDVYVLNNDCRKCSDDSDGYYWEYTPGDCDVENNGKWSCIYMVGSQEYQMVYTSLDITSAAVGMLDQFDRGLQTNVQVFVDFDYAMGRSITVMESRYELRLVAGIAMVP